MAQYGQKFCLEHFKRLAASKIANSSDKRSMSVLIKEYRHKLTI